MTDALQLKENIVSIIESRGPMMPNQVARETGQSILFSSAFLSELYNEKRIKMSYMRIGSSPLYFIHGQESQLEKFSNYLKNKEKEAFLMLKENKFLEDSKLHPAIRVAMREIKDFAIPFKKDEEIFWKFFTITDEEIRNLIEKSEPKEIIKEEKNEIISEKEKPEEKMLNIFDKEKISEEVKPIEKKKKEPVKKTKKETAKKTSKKKDENFFNKIKESLAEQKIEILDIIDFKNDEAKIKIKKDDSEKLLFVFNKKKITEKEILKANKESAGEKYQILFFGEPSKKLNDFIDAIKNLSEIGKIN